MGRCIHFVVHGQPATQGSKRSVPIYSKGKPVIKKGRVITRVIDDNPKVVQWKQQVAYFAAQALDEANINEMFSGAIFLRLVFQRPRPKSHYGTGRNARRLKSSAPPHPTTKPDLLKLARAVEDALSGVVYRDDAQIVKECLKKKYGPHFAVDVTIMEIDGCDSECVDVEVNRESDQEARPKIS
ncbi:MAG: RusA family crossover junction endodeoxyribonuclease [Deltaproteobacteria bacterium]|nr:MAG: RusA family crossover junction endodeoxyribonuclease [Deltaproteobacteria bacterium]